MNIEKKSDNCYRARKMYNGQMYRFYFDHYPTEIDLAKALAEKLNTIDTKSIRQSFEVCANEYLTIKKNVLSPATYRSYNGILKQLPSSFKSKDINSIEQTDIQIIINNMVNKKAPKTIRNYHGFISAVFGVFRPSFIIDTTLPQNVEYEAITPLEEDIKRILDSVANTKYSVPFQLGVLGMRRSEICAATPSDINGNFLSVNKAKVESENGFIIKNYTKTEKSRRNVYIPDSLVEEITNNNVIFDGFPSMLLHTLHKTQNDLGINKFRFHDLRAFYASYAHSCGIPDAIIMANGGWATDYVMKKLYRRALQNDVEYYQEALAQDLLKN